MRFGLSAEQAELRRAARGYLATHWPSAQVRAASEDGSPEDPSAWRRLAAELGWASILVPDGTSGA